MGYYKTTGIVLRRMNLGEADRIITFLTRDHGKVRAVAKGVRRIKSRMAGHLEPFGTVELMFAEGRNLDIITSARLLRSADSITEHPNSLAQSFLLAEMLDRLTLEGAEQTVLFDVVDNCYLDLSQRGGDAVVELYFKLRLLETLGYRPRLDGCSVCGNRDLRDAYYFEPEIGGIVDDTCSISRQFLISLNQIKLWRLMLSNLLPDIRRLQDVTALSKDSLNACNYFYEYTFGKRFLTSAALFE